MGRTLRPTKGTPKNIIDRQRRVIPDDWEPVPVHRSPGAFPVAIAAGIVTTIRRDSVTLVQGPRARTWVQWHDHKLPPGVAIGRDVMAYGKLMTFGNARSFQIINSVLIKAKSRQSLCVALSKFLNAFIVEPLPKEAKTNGDGLAGLVLPEPEMPDDLS